MDITPLVPAERKLIQSYGGGGFVISQERFEGPVLVFPDQVTPWIVTTFSGLSFSDFEPVISSPDPVEILLIGCGEIHQRIQGQLMEKLAGAGIGVDTMDTGAACRTYSVLASEDRRVAAALFPV